jgi:16S rRNA (guanine966-N2)-methyltransferase
MRVIAGIHGGRRLRAPAGRATRPTSDRVREAMFMALEPLAGLRVVDLFAGSGALGIEALSRGAEFADFVEPHRDARRALDENLAALGLGDRARVWPVALPRSLARLGEALSGADVVLMDPPYGGDLARETLAALGVPGRLRDGARVVLEHHHRDGPPAAAGVLTRERRRSYGETEVSTYRVRPAGGAPEPHGGDA